MRSGRRNIVEHPLRVARRRGALPSLAISNHTRPEPMSTHHCPPLPITATPRASATCSIDTIGSGTAFPMASIPTIDYRCSDMIVVQRNMLRPEGCRASCNFGTTSMRIRQAARAGDSRSPKASGEPSRNGRNGVCVRSTRYPARRATRQPSSSSLVIFRVPPIHIEELPWLSNSTDCRRKNCRP